MLIVIWYLVNGLASGRTSVPADWVIIADSFQHGKIAMNIKLMDLKKKSRHHGFFNLNLNLNILGISTSELDMIG